MRELTGLLLALAWAGCWALAAEEPPLEWIDPSTHHRVIRFSREPGSSSLYFHQNAYTASGDKMVFSTRDGLSTVDLKTRRIEPLLKGRVSHVVVGPKTRQVFYIQGGTVYATHLDTRATRAIVTRPELRSGSGLTVNADETMLAGSFVEGGWGVNRPRPAPGTAPETAPGTAPVTAPGTAPGNVPGAAPGTAPGPGRLPGEIESMLESRWAARRPMALYTIRIDTGEVKIFHRSTDWLNHVQFSPADPTLLMFCHEGPWHRVDRIWTIRTDGAGLRKIHTRTMEMEIAGHEFWSPDGKIIWYDLQTPKGQEFWLAGLVLSTGRKIRYRIERDQWSVHFNVSRDRKLFAGDGGGPQMVAKAKDGQWIYLFRPKKGALRWERLVNLTRHDYRLEPNVSFTPDRKWIVFRSNMHGPMHVYAVEVAKARR
jgi:oligogalacturonide lyase